MVADKPRPLLQNSLDSWAKIKLVKLAPVPYRLFILLGLFIAYKSFCLNVTNLDCWVHFSQDLCNKTSYKIDSVTSYTCSALFIVHIQLRQKCSWFFGWEFPPRDIYPSYWQHLLYTEFQNLKICPKSYIYLLQRVTFS